MYKKYILSWTRRKKVPVVCDSITERFFVHRALRPKILSVFFVVQWKLKSNYQLLKIKSQTKLGQGWKFQWRLRWRTVTLRTRWRLASTCPPTFSSYVQPPNPQPVPNPLCRGTATDRWYWSGSLHSASLQRNFLILCWL